MAFFWPLDSTNERWDELQVHPDWHYGSDYPSFISLIEAQLRVVARHPDTTFISAHVLSYAENLNYVASAEGYCLRCHGSQQNVNFAPKLNRGRYLMIVLGCLGCHQVKTLPDMPKAGMNFLRLKGRLSKDFVEKFAWDPKSLNPQTRMPCFFHQSNQSDADGLSKTKAEILSIVEYLYEHSLTVQPGRVPPPGNMANGKKLFKEVGCSACHGIDDVTTYHNDFAPDLSATGSKLSASFVYTWIKNPPYYDSETRMPSQRLSDREAADLTAYLMSKRNKSFEQSLPVTFEPRTRDDLLLEYLKPDLGEEGAYQKLSHLKERDRTLLLGEKSISKYGCYGCHDIQGFETAPHIGSELSEWGVKPINQLDFGYTHLPSTREDFINNKLEDPRIFDRGKAVGFKDGLKMPNFYLSDEDREAIVTAVLGMTNTFVPDEMKAGIHGNGPLLEKGRKVLAILNCRGCHLVEDQGGFVREMYENEGADFSMAPPDLHTEGAKVQITWFQNYLRKVQPIRPWLRIRMPSFQWSDRDLSDLITYFNLKDNQVYPFWTPDARTLAGTELIQARALFSKLQCQKCHVLGKQIPRDITSAAPDLQKVQGRLKPDWVVEFLKNPDNLLHGTRMPSYWPDGISPMPQYFQGDSTRQEEALKDYLFMLPVSP